jgi:hypothetical protein
MHRFRLPVILAIILLATRPRSFATILASLGVDRIPPLYVV